MNDDNKTKKQLVQELAELRSQNAELKKSVSGSISAELAAEEVLRYAENGNPQSDIVGHYLPSGVHCENDLSEGADI